MLNALFVEAALEIVPRKINRHPSVTRNAKRDGKNPEGVLLDRSLHHRAMLDLPEGEKRGRPDILHFCLLEALGSPLNKAGKLKSMAQTLNGDFIDFAPELRLPRDCNRFDSLMEQLFAEKRVPPGGEEKPLMTLVRKSLKDIKGEIHPSRTFALTSHGKAEKLDELCKRLAVEENPLVFLGAYPHGAMREETLAEADEAVSIHPEALEAWVVTSRLIYEYEKASGLE
jgi:rRNA small subunit pseudouridine methyltransferase Nep1